MVMRRAESKPIKYFIILLILVACNAQAMRGRSDQRAPLAVMERSSSDRLSSLAGRERSGAGADRLTPPRASLARFHTQPTIQSNEEAPADLPIEDTTQQIKKTQTLDDAIIQSQRVFTVAGDTIANREGLKNAIQESYGNMHWK